MEKFVTFHNTEKGYLHSLMGVPCEDYSASVSNENSYSIVSVSDGIGDPKCCRSAVGSEIAVRSALSTLEEFAESYYKDIDHNKNGNSLDTIQSDSYCSTFKSMQLKKEQEIIIKRLTDTMLSRWFKKVKYHYEKNPLSENELLLLNNAIEYNEIELLYSCTLIAVLWIRDYIIVIQQGDGRCFVRYENDKLTEPIPRDNLCINNITTSLSDTNASDTIRHAVINIKECIEKPIGIYICSDGLDNSFIIPNSNHKDTEECLSYIKTIEQALISNDNKMLSFMAWLKENMKETSKNGSGDDISLAAIINLAGLKNNFSSFINNTHIPKN